MAKVLDNITRPCSSRSESVSLSRNSEQVACEVQMPGLGMAAAGPDIADSSTA